MVARGSASLAWQKISMQHAVHNAKEEMGVTGKEGYNSMPPIKGMLSSMAQPVDASIVSVCLPIEPISCLPVGPIACLPISSLAAGPIPPLAPLS